MHTHTYICNNGDLTVEELLEYMYLRENSIEYIS